MRYGGIVLAMLLAVPAGAPPPPPPRGPSEAAVKLLLAPKQADWSALTALFAPDIAAERNGVMIAEGKPAWTAWLKNSLAHYYGHVLVYSESWGEDENLLIVDTYDTEDLAPHPPAPPPPGDPRPNARTIYYKFGPDHLIHLVRIAETNLFWMVPH